MSAFLAVLLWNAVGMAQPVHAAADAGWSGDSLLYENHGYSRNDSFVDPSGTIPDDAIVYQSEPQVITGASARKVFIIYFSAGTDPPKETAAKYAEFDLTATGTLTGSPSDRRDIAVNPAGTQDETTSSCSVGGIGWIICPVSIFLAEQMDNIFGFLATFIKVQPTVLGDPNDSLYVAWNVSRSIANVAFVIAFLIIIYSQVTGLGVSNYGLKRLLPRLVIAAILVNVSFYVAALAIDISNILGYAIQDVFTTIREELFSLTNDDLSNNPALTSTWSAVTTIILGGTGGIIGGTYFVANGGLWLLIPLLIGLVLTLLFVLLVLAARQAIIILLVIVAPLAFVANLLPNTEKWFERWKDLFMTMLIFFPAFSLVFGGSQLAGQLIIKNGGDNIITLLFGMAVQVAPLVITPLLLKLSGSLLGRIAQLVNDPRKGFIDRSRNWATDRATLTRQRNIADGVRANPLSWGAGMVRWRDQRQRRLKERIDLYTQAADNVYHQTAGHHKVARAAKLVDLDKHRIEDQHTAELEREMGTRGTALHLMNIRADAAKAGAEKMTARTAKVTSGYRAGTYDTGGDQQLAGLQRQMAQDVMDTSSYKQGEQNNVYEQTMAFATAMRTDDALQRIAEGYGDAAQRKAGRDRARASAIGALDKIQAEATKNYMALIRSEANDIGKKDIEIATEYFEAAKDPTKGITDGQLEAALEILRDDGQMLVFEDAAKSLSLKQQLVVDRVINRDLNAFKIKGGFHIQNKMGLRLARYIERAGTTDESQKLMYYDIGTGTTRQVMTEEEARIAFDADLKRERLVMMAGTNANGLGAQKYSMFEDTAKNLDELVRTLDLSGRDTKRSQDDLKIYNSVHNLLRRALSDQVTVNHMNDRIDLAREMDAYMAPTRNEKPVRIPDAEVQRPVTLPPRRPRDSEDAIVLDEFEESGTPGETMESPDA